LAREQGIDLKVLGLDCLPQEIKKYTGNIWRHQRSGGVVVYAVIIKHKDFKRYATFNTEAEAEQHIL